LNVASSDGSGLFSLATMNETSYALYSSDVPYYYYIHLSDINSTTCYNSVPALVLDDAETLYVIITDENVLNKSCPVTYSISVLESAPPPPPPPPGPPPPPCPFSGTYSGPASSGGTLTVTLGTSCSYSYSGPCAFSLSSTDCTNEPGFAVLFDNIASCTGTCAESSTFCSGAQSVGEGAFDYNYVGGSCNNIYASTVLPAGLMNGTLSKTSGGGGGGSSTVIIVVVVILVLLLVGAAIAVLLFLQFSHRINLLPDRFRSSSSPLPPQPEV